MKNEPGMAYKMKTLNKVFAVLSILFLFSTIWMVLDDSIRPWKAVQIKSMEIKNQVLTEKIKAAEEGIDSEKLNAIKEKIKAAEEEFASNEEKVADINNRLAEVQRKIYVQNMTKGIFSSKVQATQFQYEHAADVGKKAKAKRLKKKFDEYRAGFVQSDDVLKTYQAEESENFKREKSCRECCY
jgi:hypothetical protein